MDESPKLFPYQEEGARWLASRKVGLLADEMGLGKSAQAIRACDLIDARRILVLCPAAVRVNWQREFQLFSTGFHFQIISGRSDAALAEIISEGDRLYKIATIASYDLASEVQQLSGDYDAIILDEAHYLKSLTTKRTKSVFGRTGLVRRGKRIWALSGTPMPNHPGELWVLLYSFGATRLSYDQFIEQHCNYYIFGSQKKILGPLPASIPTLRSMIRSISIRRTKEEVMPQLPPITFSQFVVEAGPVDIDVQFVQYVFPLDRIAQLDAELLKQRELLNTVIAALPQGQTKVDPSDQIRPIEALARSISTLRRYTGLQKLKQLGDMLEQELKNNAYDKVVIFAIHQGVIEGLRDRLNQFGVVTLYGNTPTHKRQINIDKFQKQKSTRVFIGNIQAAGTGITLTAAHHVVFAEYSFVPGENAQAAMRVHRIGQQKPVFVRFCALANSFDEFIVNALKRKTRNITQLVEGIDDPGPAYVDLPKAIDTLPRTGSDRQRVKPVFKPKLHLPKKPS